MIVRVIVTSDEVRSVHPEVACELPSLDRFPEAYAEVRGGVYAALVHYRRPPLTVSFVVEYAGIWPELVPEGYRVVAVEPDGSILLAGPAVAIDQITSDGKP